MLGQRKNESFFYFDVNCFPVVYKFDLFEIMSFCCYSVRFIYEKFHIEIAKLREILGEILTRKNL